MKMRCAGVSGDSDVAQYLSTLHPISLFYAQAAGFKMRVIRKLLSAQVNHDRVS